jgi:hypothetical protein
MMKIDATATNAARVHGAKEKIFLKNKNLSSGGRKTSVVASI